MHSKTLQSNLFLFMASAIWGLSIVAQRIGAQYIGAFTFNGIRFALGSLSLLPLIYFLNKNKIHCEIQRTQLMPEIKKALMAGILPGMALYLAASFQQIGLVSTTAAKTSFITGLYIVLVPFLGTFFKQRIGLSTWFGGGLAVIGLYFLTDVANFSISKGDFLILIGSFFWAAHILLIAHFSTKVDTLILSAFQFAICSIFSIITALFFETISMNIIKLAIIPILYGGICSVGIGYTLQVIGQQHAQPSHAAIILSMEVVVGAVGGWLILNENLGVHGILGGLLMFAGMLVSQIDNFNRSKTRT